MSVNRPRDCTTDRTDDAVVTRVEPEPGTSVTVSIVRAVAETEGVAPAKLPLLSDVVDPEGLDALFTGLGPAGRSSLRVSFDYCGYTVLLADGSVTLLSNDGSV